MVPDKVVNEFNQEESERCVVQYLVVFCYMLSSNMFLVTLSAEDVGIVRDLLNERRHPGFPTP